MRIAINGFGRIGRCVLRSILDLQDKDLHVVVINTPSSIDTSLHLLKYDSVHGVLNYEITKNTDDSFVVQKQEIKHISYRNINEIPWNLYDIDVVLECSGKFNSKDLAIIHVKSGTKKVLVSAPVSDADKTIIYGVNDNDISKEDIIISAGSCTTNCAAPIVSILDKEIGIKSGFLTTVHAYTNDQNTLDNSHKDLRRSRACALSMVPTKTGASNAIVKLFPHLQNKLLSSAIRVPVPNVSLVDAVINLKKSITVDNIHNIFQYYSENNLKGVLGVSKDLKVSIDFLKNSYSSIYDYNETYVLDNSTCRIVCWYDNEWGFANRMIDIIKKISV